MTGNTRRASPERTLLLFAAFLLLAAVAGVKDCSRRATLESSRVVPTDAP